MNKGYDYFWLPTQEETKEKEAAALKNVLQLCEPILAQVSESEMDKDSREYVKRTLSSLRSVLEGNYEIANRKAPKKISRSGRARRT